MDDLARIRAALADATDALEALARLEGALLPAMPAEWLFEDLTCGDETWFFCMRQLNTSRYLNGQGLTPRAAMLAAFAQRTS